MAVGRDIAKLEALMTRLRGLAGKVEAFRADLTQDDDLSGLAEYVSYTSGRLDILVHSAGLYARGKLEKSSINTMDALQPQTSAVPICSQRNFCPFSKDLAGKLFSSTPAQAFLPVQRRDSFQLLSRRSRRLPTDCATR